MPTDGAPQTTARTSRPRRIGKVSVTGHFTPEVRRQVKRLTADADSTVQAILGDAPGDPFAKHGVFEIAESNPEFFAPRKATTAAHRMGDFVASGWIENEEAPPAIRGRLPGSHGEGAASGCGRAPRARGGRGVAQL